MRMKRTIWLWLVVGVWGLVGLAPPPAGAQNEAPTATPRPGGARDPRFGVVEAFWSPEQAAALGPGWERILFYWSEIQPAGPEDWNTLHVLEEWLREADAQGRQVVGLLKHTPAWATDGPAFGGVPRGLYLPVEDPDNLWANYVRRIAAYYGPLGVHHWIIWNEPDIDVDTYGNEFAGSVADYYRLVKVAYLVMKETDPQAQIHLAGVTFWHDELAGREQYVQRFLEVAAADPEAAAHGYFFDYLSLHIYFRVETVGWIVTRMEEIQASFGLDKPIWIVETNAAPTMDPLWPVERPTFAVDLAQQAWYIVQAYALGFAAGAESIGVYKFSDVLVPPGAESFGLLRADFSERPAFVAYQTVIEYLQGFTAVAVQETAAYRVVSFTRPGDTVHVLWAREPTAVTLRFPAGAAAATLVTALGETAPLPAVDGAYLLTLEGARCYDECIIGGPPLLVVEPRPGDATPETPAPVPASPTPFAAPALVAANTATPFPTPTPLPTATPLPAPAGADGRMGVGLFLLAGAALLGGVLLLFVWWRLRLVSA